MKNNEFYNHLNSIIYLIDDYYFHNMAKTFIWINSPCKELGNAIPLHLIEDNNTGLLIEYINHTL